MRKPGIIRCKDCLAFEEHDHSSYLAGKVGYCRSKQADVNAYVAPTIHILSAFPHTTSECYCLQAVPREPGTCGDCCYFEPQKAQSDDGVCTYSNDFFYPARTKDCSCRHWRPCSEDHNA